MPHEAIPSAKDVFEYREELHRNLDSFLKRFPNTPEGRHAMDQAMLAIDLTIDRLGSDFPKTIHATFDDRAVDEALTTSKQIIDVVAAPRAKAS